MAFNIACFSKNRQAAGSEAPKPPSVIRLSYTGSLAHVSHFRHFHFLILVHTQTSASGLPFYDIFVPQKVTLSKIFDDVIACNLWFGPPPIKNPGYAYEKMVVDLI